MHMKIVVTVKSVGKKKEYLTQKEWELFDEPSTLRELITAVVKKNVQDFNNQEVEAPLMNYLTQSDIKEQGVTGKVSFGAHYNENKADVTEAIRVALQAFADGLYKVYVREEEIEELDIPLQCQDGDAVAFIKLTMLAGRMW